MPVIEVSDEDMEYLTGLQTDTNEESILEAVMVAAVVVRLATFYLNKGEEVSLVRGKHSGSLLPRPRKPA